MKEGVPEMVHPLLSDVWRLITLLAKNGLERENLRGSGGLPVCVPPLCSPCWCQSHRGCGNDVSHPFEMMASATLTTCAEQELRRTGDSGYRDADRPIAPGTATQH